MNFYHQTMAVVIYFNFSKPSIVSYPPSMACQERCPLMETEGSSGLTVPSVFHASKATLSITPSLAAWLLLQSSPPHGHLHSAPAAGNSCGRGSVFSGFGVRQLPGHCDVLPIPEVGEQCLQTGCKELRASRVHADISGDFRRLWQIVHARVCN